MAGRAAAIVWLLKKEDAFEVAFDGMAAIIHSKIVT